MKRSNRGRTLCFQSACKPVVEILEHRQLLSATLRVGTQLVFNAVQNGSTSATQTLTLTDTGTSPLTLGSSGLSVVNDPAVSGQDAARFSILNSSSAPASLSPGQSFTLQVNYSAKAVGINSAILNIKTNDSAAALQQVALRGIGTKGLGGTNQPSLATILRAYNIPTIVGEGKNDADAAIDSTYPNPPDASSQEVPMQRIVKAGAGPVTIQTLASFTASGFSRSYVLGTYTPGSPSSLNELFYTSANENQTTNVHPLGTTTFDPGATPFGFYFVSNVQVKGRIGYTEDALNNWDTTNPRKFRFFPLENRDGSPVANAYVMTSTEWNAPAGYDFTNIVAVVRNIKAAPGGPVLGLQNANAVTGSNRMVFTRIQNQNPTLGDQVHDTGTLQITNTGTQPLVISSYSITGGWTLVNPPTFPLTVAAGAKTSLTIKFVATSAPSVPYNETSSPLYPTSGGVYNGTLKLFSNDPNQPTVSVPLAGYWQNRSENNNEPSLQSIVNLLHGWTTNINPKPISELSQNTSTTNSAPTYYGEEVASGYWAEADTTLPVNVQQIAAYHTQGNTATTYWYPRGSSSRNKLFTTAADDGQTLFPYATGTTTPATGTFSTTGIFGFDLDGEFSDDAMNAYKAGGGHEVRFFPLRDGNGSLVANSYLVTMDYASATANFDFQDNVFLVSNIRPATVQAAPGDFAVAGTQGGVSLQWAPVQSTTLKGYNVYRSTSATGTFSLLTATPSTQTGYLDSTAPVGATEYYEVTAVDSVTGVESLAVSGKGTALTTSSNPTAPPAPTNLVAKGISGAVTLQWSAVVDATLLGYNVYRSSSASGTYTRLTASPTTATSFLDSAAPPGTAEFYRVTAVDAASGLESAAAVASGTALASSTGLTSLDIGASPAGSTTVITPGADYDVTAGGPGVTSTVDGFRFLYQSHTGDFDLKVQVRSITVAGNFSTAGIMARSTLDTTSPDVYMSASPVNYRFKWRTSVGTINNVTASGTPGYPNVWVRLVRVGNLFTGYSSSDGKNWTKISSVTETLPTTLFLGLAVASNVTTTTTTASLRGFGDTTPVVQPPAAPTNLSAVGTQGGVTLKWTASTDATLKGYKVYSSSSASGTYALLTSTPIAATTFNDTKATIGAATFYRVTAVDASSGLESAPVTASATAVAAPAPLSSIDIGATPGGGTTVVTPGTDYNVTAGGPGVTDVSDGFRFLYAQQTGDFDVKVQVQSITVAGNFATAGIMARSTLDANAANVYISATPANFRFKDRPTAGATTTVTAGGTPSYPNVWVRLQRVGNLFTGYTSTDGVHWTTMSSVTVVLPATIDLGLAVASNVSTQTTSAVLRGYGNT